MMSDPYAVGSFNPLKEHTMSKTTHKTPMTQQQLDHHSNQRNPNYGTTGTNPANAKVNGNRGEQLNPNRK